MQKRTGKVKKLKNDCFGRKRKYEKAKGIAGERNSYSKTDRDGPCMRMKEEHLGKGQLKPAYHIQIGTERGFVVGYDILPNSSDTRTLKRHLRKQKRRLGQDPQREIADTG
jgi:hypothetical protein